MRTKGAAVKADSLLHPIRMRLVQVLAQGRALTPAQLAEALPDVPQATLYRHLQKLAEAGLVTVVSERAVRGARERTYALPASGAVLSQGDVAEASSEDHMRYFTTFVAGLLGEFARYTEGGDVDLARDRVGYRTLPLYLSDDEFDAMAAALSKALQPFAAQGPAPGRTLRHFSTVVMPAADVAPADD